VKTPSIKRSNAAEGLLKGVMPQRDFLKAMILRLFTLKHCSLPSGELFNLHLGARITLGIVVLETST
jgi:hypothetical protein